MVKIPNPLEDTEDEQTEEETEDEEPEEVHDNILGNRGQQKCTRYVVCGNWVYGSTCPECWEDIRKQLETGTCEECGNDRFKFNPDGEEVGLECKECGDTDWQTVEYTGDETEDPRNDI